MGAVATTLAKKVDATSLAKKVDAAMQKAGIATRGELAAKCGISESTLSESLKDASEGIRLKTLLRLAKVFNLTVEYLIEGIDPEYDASRTTAPVQARVLALWDLAVRRGQAEKVWGLLHLAADVDDEPLPTPQQPQPSPDPSLVG